ncbi:MAG TPA: SRPBCC family protein [Jatrophihabitantaceae bacterium]|nr:SRPBCC family protein [Jatrophihabitantaceae bacterium]
MRFVNTITIDRAPSAVFAYLAEFENVPRWNYAIADTRKVTDGPVGVGARYLQMRTIPSRSEETFEVVEFEPDRRLVIRGQIGPFSGDIAYLLEGAANATVLTNTCDLRAHGPLSVVAPLATRRVQSAVAANLDVLKQILERP